MLGEEEGGFSSGCANFFSEGRRFETKGGRKFLLGKQLLSSHMIQPGSFLLLEFQIMA